ncbi:GNAT family N-acetyltransferase [Microbacterium sp. zg.Y1090]|uniref:GNAT family N-acetyltransferase n=1 Tax=Microbacterium wangruii TaxID=3049073 RepID=UPI00214AD20D|nr:MULTISPECIES: GNAT family N-acetyltransferase [unclassified Microbacterium]MCR2817567.1 GNAT family N-acetyltransferase [Microbacterium sp. zg.Y1090]WIM28954.1 GNAT family N-acetyltransferase [Microbacterium sp. zg-Y1090]
MTRIRPFRPGDEPALADVCLLTADAGADATGVLADDDLWAEVFVLPYAARHPDLAFVVESDHSRVVGYTVAVPDTRAFEDWFATEWWPRHADRWPEPEVELTRQDGILRYAYGRRAGAEPYGDAHPAHLHIDLLPEVQGQGWGRRLIDTVSDALRERGVSGLHLVSSADNAGALAFYDRLGFTRLPSHDGVQAFARTL